MYLGNEPSNNFVSLKRQDITGDGTASYTLDYAVSSVNDVLIYVNHVKQANDSYSISGTSLTMGGNVSSSDDFYIIYLGQGLQTVTPADNTITNNMLSETITVANGGTGLTSGFKNGITMADQWRLSAHLTAGADPISSNLERVDEDTFAKIGTGMSLSSGIWSFPQTGLYDVHSTAHFRWNTNNDAIQVETHVSSDSGSSYDRIARINLTCPGDASYNHSASTNVFVNVTDVSTFRLKFILSSLNSGNELQGFTDYNFTFFTFYRLGDSQ